MLSEFWSDREARPGRNNHKEAPLDTQREPVSRWPRDRGGSGGTVIMADLSLHPWGGQRCLSATRPAALNSLARISRNDEFGGL